MFFQGEFKCSLSMYHQLCNPSIRRKNILKLISLKSAMVRMGTGTGIAAQLHDSEICDSACGKSGCQSPRDELQFVTSSDFRVRDNSRSNCEGDCHPVYR